MEENLVGYLLGSLDEAGMRQVEAQLQTSPEARRRLALVRQALGPLAADRDDAAPPPGLAARTLAHVADAVGRDLPRAPRDPAAPVASRGGWWRRADVVVAAGLVLLAVGLAAPVVYHWQHQRGTIACQENLRQFFVALASYRDQSGAYPDPSREAPRNVAGLVVPILADAGVLPPSFSVRCPEVGPHLGCPVTLAGLRAMSDTDFQQQAPNLALCYAFTLGYRDPGGAYHGPWQLPGSSLPILADRPPSEAITGNSVNHGGAGQNVLFLDGHVRFLPQRTAGDPDDDIFLNRANLVAAGLDPHDIVLGYSAARP
jgi:prepilin-type processing-associated H-X9-DG protein